MGETRLGALKSEQVINTCTQGTNVSQLEQLCSLCQETFKVLAGRQGDDEVYHIVTLTPEGGFHVVCEEDMEIPTPCYYPVERNDNSYVAYYNTEVGPIVKIEGSAYTFWYKHLDSGLESASINELIAAIRTKPKRPLKRKLTDEILRSDDVANYSQHPDSDPENDSMPSVTALPLARNGPVVRNGWYGAVGVEPNPGPTPKKVKAAKVKVREVVKVVERKPKRSTGHKVGSKIGGFIGSLAQKAIQSITGMGDYTVNTNSCYNNSTKSGGPPAFLLGKGGACRIPHREYIGDVISIGNNFNLSRFPISPTSAQTFPWLSQIANNFEQFKFHGLVFEFVTASATAVASTNTALGRVILATQYNSIEAPFTTKLQMEQYQFCVATVPSESAIHPVECAPDLGAPEFLYLSEAGNYNGDARWNQLGFFSLATVGQQSAANIGELWVSYDVELVKSRLPGNIQSGGLGVRWMRNSNNFSIPLTQFSYTDPWNSVAQNQSYIGNSTSVIRFLPGGQIQFAPGYYGFIEINICHQPTNTINATTVPVAWNIVGRSINVQDRTAYPLVNGSSNTEMSYQLYPANTGQIWSHHSQRIALNITASANGQSSFVTINQNSNPGYGICALVVYITQIAWV